MVLECDLVKALGFKTVIPSADGRLAIEVSNVNRPGLQLAGYWDFFGFERPQLLQRLDALEGCGRQGGEALEEAGTVGVDADVAQPVAAGRERGSGRVELGVGGDDRVEPALAGDREVAARLDLNARP